MLCLQNPPLERRAPSAPEANPGAEIVVQYLADADSFARLAPQWNRLHERAPAASVFTSWIWQYQWWQVYGGGQPLRLLVAMAGGEVVGILALYIQKTKVVRVPVRMLRFVGTGGDTHPDDLGPVLAPEREPEIAAKLAEAALRISDADALVLSDIAPASGFALVMERCAAEARRSCFTSPCERIAYVELPPTWPEYLKSLSSDRRTRIKSARKKAAAAHQVRFFVWEDAAHLDEAVDRLVELHRKRWHQKEVEAAGGSESFQSDEYIDFHRRTIKASFARGWLRLYCLELDGEVAAITYCYRFRNGVYLMQAGFDPEKAKCNPGKVLLGYALEHAIGEGNVVFDFLRGDHRYKNQLATGHRVTTCIRVFRATPGGLAYRLRRITLPLLKARLYRQAAPKLKV